MGNRDDAKARAAVYRLLSSVFLQEPTVPFLASLTDRDVLRVLGKLGGDWIARLPEMDMDALADELGCEYARLFVGPGFHVHPYESLNAHAGAGRATADMQLYGSATSAVLEFYRHADIAPATAFRGLPDHVGVELECMSHLTSREARYWELENVGAAISSLRLQQIFLSQHLVLWLPGFARRVRGIGAHPYYCTMVKAATRFVKVDSQNVDELLGRCLVLDGENCEPNEAAASVCSHHRR